MSARSGMRGGAWPAGQIRAGVRMPEPLTSLGANVASAPVVTSPALVPNPTFTFAPGQSPTLVAPAATTPVASDAPSGPLAGLLLSALVIGAVAYAGSYYGARAALDRSRR